MSYELKLLMKKKFLHLEHTRKNCSKSPETKKNHDTHETNPNNYCPVKLFGCIRISSNHARGSLSSILGAYFLCPIATI